MPFTFSHPAIILPLTRQKKWFSTTALFIGSLTPDFDYFIKLRASTSFAHSIKGVFLFDIPFGLCLIFFWNMFLKKELTNHLPFQIKESKIELHNHKIRPYLIATLSLIIGIFSHLFWDAFTHGNGYTVVYFHQLSNNFIFFNSTIKIYAFLQVISSIVGLIIVVIYLRNNYLLSMKWGINKVIIKFWLKVLIFQTLILVFRFSIIQDNNTIEDIVMSIIGSFLYSFIIICFLNHKKLFRNNAYCNKFM